jgi:C-terminal processing protease CtpA/Prc
MFSRDTGSTKQYWSVRDLRGTRFGGKKPVYVLISQQTFSGGEEFAYDLQALRRAQLVGDTTRGGANPVLSPHDLDDWFRILVPDGRPINPITKTNWEGVGVVPEIWVSADGALEEAHRHALHDVAASRRR